MQSIKFFSTVMLTALTLGLCGCGKDYGKPTPPPQLKPAVPQPDYVVAMVNATPLTWDEMDKRAMGYLKDDVETNHLIIPTNRMDEAKEYFRRRAINAFVFKTVMMDEAAKQKIRIAEADRQEGLRALAISLKQRNWTTNDFFLKGPMGETAMRREFDDGLIIDKLLKVAVRNKLKIDDQEITHAIELIGVTNDLKRAKLEAVRKQLTEGANFEDVARNVSDCQSARKGGDLGEFSRGKMVKEFDDAAFKQEVGVIGPIVETPFGYHLIKVAARTPAQAATATTPALPETVRASHILLKRIPVDRKKLNESILRVKYNKGVEQYFRELKAKAKIECFLFKDMTF